MASMSGTSACAGSSKSAANYLPEVPGGVRMNGRRRIAWFLILIVDAGMFAWGAMAAALPDYLLGPGGKPILAAGYEGFSGGSWAQLASTSPMTVAYIAVLFRMYGIYCALFGLLASAIAVT